MYLHGALKMLKNMSIKVSLLFLLISFTLLQIISNSAELFFLSKNQQSTQLLHNIIKEQNALHSTTEAVFKLRRLLDNVQVDNSADIQRRLKLAQNEFTKAHQEFNIFWEIPGLTADDQEAGNKIKVVFEQQMDNEKQHMEELKDILSGNSLAVLSESLEKTRRSGREDFDSQLEKYFDNTMLAGETVVNQANSQINTSILKIAVILGITVLLFIGSQFWIKRSIISPISMVSEHFARIGEGDLSHPVQVDSTNEIGSLCLKLQHMQGELSKTVATIRDGVNTINTGMQEIATGNADLSTRTEQQAAAVVETAASMEQISATTRNNTDKARQASEMVNDSADMALRGERLMSDMVEKIHTISRDAESVNEISNVIDSIAFQTNILALNAAVEAARAGESGRGFAVVATEVRNLAQRSAASAKEISALVAQATASVNEGVELAEHSGAMMAKISEAVRNINVLMDDISGASEEQSGGIEQIRVAVTQMEQVTQQNASLVEEIAATTGSVEEQSDTLNQAVAIFRIAPQTSS